MTQVKNKSSVAYHIETVYLFTRSDYKTIFFPVVHLKIFSEAKMLKKFLDSFCSSGVIRLSDSRTSPHSRVGMVSLTASQCIESDLQRT